MSTLVTIDFDEVFDNFIKANQKKWTHDRSSTLGASEVFSCLRKAWFDKLGKQHGHKPDEDYEDDWGATTRGDLIENYFVVPAVDHHMPDGIEMLFTGDNQKTLVSGKNSATPDGLITGLPKGCSVRIKGGPQDITIPNIISDCIVLEIKSIDPRAVLLEERAKHHNQTQVQLGLFHEKTEWRPYYSVVLYIDASFLSNVTPFVVEYDPKVYLEAKKRGDGVYEITNPTDIMPEGRFTGDCQHCKWRRACGTANVGAIPTFDTDPKATPETIEKLDVLVKDCLAKKAALDAAERAHEISKEMVKEFLSERNSRKFSGPDWSVTWFPQKGRETIDTKALERDGVDLEPYKRQGDPFDVLRITPKVAKTPKKK